MLELCSYVTVYGFLHLSIHAPLPGSFVFSCEFVSLYLFILIGKTPFSVSCSGDELPQLLSAKVLILSDKVLVFPSYLKDSFARQQFSSLNWQVLSFITSHISHPSLPVCKVSAEKSLVILWELPCRQ